MQIGCFKIMIHSETINASDNDFSWYGICLFDWMCTDI